MPHATLIALAGFRIREPEMLALGMTLPALATRAGAVGALPPLGVLTLAGLTPPNWSLSLHQPRAVTDALVQQIVSERPDIAAISALTASINDAYRLADALRAQGLPVVLGGLHATACPHEAAAHADAVVTGDGEASWTAVLGDAAAGRLRPLYRPSHAFDLAAAPVPRFDLLGAAERPRYTLQTQRGCPLACEFCGASRLLGPFREKPASRIARELAAIRVVAPRRPTIELADDNTFAARRDPAELLDVLERADVRYFTECDWRLGERPDILERLAPSGCVQVLVGFESLAHRAGPLKGLGAKRAPLDRMLAAAANIQAAGVAVIGCFVLGCDGEDHESMLALADLLETVPLADVQVTIQTPFPGTALRRRLEAQGRLLPDRGWESCTLFDVTYRPDRLSVEQLEHGFRHVVRTAFAPGPAARREEIRRAVWARRGQWAAPVVQEAA